MKQLIISMVFSVFSLLTHAAIDVQITPSTVHLDDSFQLTLTQEGTQNQSVPDLRVLQKDFRIVGTARQVNYAVINGQSTMSNQWVITLKPLKSGVLSIPAIKMGSEQSNPITINVEEPAAPATSDDAFPADSTKALLLTTQVDVTKPYVNQEIIYTVTLYNSKRLLDASYEAPQVDDALIIPLGDTKRYQTVKNNVSYVVEEQKYAVFPQKSGTLTIHAPSFTALVYDFDTQRVKVTDKDRQITVLPIPQTYPSGSWLPAKKVILKEEYENTSQTLEQGSTLVRTIQLQGSGITAQLLPALVFKEDDAFSVYPEKGNDRNQIRQGELYGSTEFKVTYLFNKPGKVILPAVKVPWFNTQTGQEEVAVLAPRSFEIVPATVGKKDLSPNSQPVPAAQDKPKQQAVSSEQKRSVALSEVKSSWLAGLAVFFACAWVITLCLWGWQKGSRTNKTNDKSALRKLKKACERSDPQEARDALLQWANTRWPDATIRSLSDVSLLVRDGQLKKQIQLLSHALYQENKTAWRGEKLLELINKLPKNKNQPKRNKDDLPGLNP